MKILYSTVWTNSNLQTLFYTKLFTLFIAFFTRINDNGKWIKKSKLHSQELTSKMHISQVFQVFTIHAVWCCLYRFSWDQTWFWWMKIWTNWTWNLTFNNSNALMGPTADCCPRSLYLYYLIKIPLKQPFIDFDLIQKAENQYTVYWEHETVFIILDKF